MKKHTRLIALLLTAALLFSLAGCRDKSASVSSTEPPAPTAPPEPTAGDIYAQARDSFVATKDVTLDITVTTYTTVNGEEFSEKSVQTLTYRGLGTEEFAADMDSTLNFGIHKEDMDAEELEESAISYRETYIGGTLYIQAMEDSTFSAAMASADAANRFIPVVLLDGALYSTITSEEAENGTKILFSQPTAAESWAMPADAKLSDASGSVLLDGDGAITQMDYSLSYTNGPAQVRIEVSSKPAAEAGEIAAPEKADSYTALQSPDAPYMTLRADALLSQANTVSTQLIEATMSEAAAYVLNQSTSIHQHGQGKDTQAKIVSKLYGKNYMNGEEQEYTNEKSFIDGRYTSVVNDGLPSYNPSIKWDDIRELSDDILIGNSLPMEYWADVTATDLGSVYLLELTLNEMFGNTAQNQICSTIFGDASLLLNMASAYETKEVTGYVSIDKFTGLPVARGYYYEGIHTIQGQKCALTMQVDQSINAPDMGAWKEITDTLPEEAEPENKAAPLFYHVTGQDGQEMWLFGTIHVGDERTAYLPQEIRDAFEASDALAIECNNEAFEEELDADEELQEIVSDAYYFSDGTTLEDLMEEEAYTKAIQLMKATGSYNMNMPYAKPYVWGESIESFYMWQVHGLHRDYGVENRLMDWAEELEIPIWEVESSLFQLQMLTGFSNDLQLIMLEDAMETTAQEYGEGVQKLYDLWCAGNEAELRKEISNKVDTSEFTEEELAEYEAQKHLIEEYDKAMSYDRNDGMLEVAIEYLESGKTVFYAVGLAHLLDDVNGLVDTLAKAGYTVELVTFQ